MGDLAAGLYFLKAVLLYQLASEKQTNATMFSCRWPPQSNALVWSDIPNNQMLRWREKDQTVSLFRQPSCGGNGNTVDREGRLVTCEQYSRRLTRTETNGKVTPLIERFEGQRFNAPTT